MTESNDSAPKMGQVVIVIEGESWRLLGTGTVRDGLVLCHLAHATKGRQQRNGWMPIQCCEWVDQNILLSASITREESARQAIAEYYSDRNKSGNAALTAHR